MRIYICICIHLKGDKAQHINSCLCLFSNLRASVVYSARRPRNWLAPIMRVLRVALLAPDCLLCAFVRFLHRERERERERERGQPRIVDRPQLACRPNCWRRRRRQLKVREEIQFLELGRRSKISGGCLNGGNHQGRATTGGWCFG